MFFAPDILAERAERFNNWAGFPFLEWLEENIVAANLFAEIVIEQGGENDDAQIFAGAQHFVNIRPQDIADRHAGIDHDEDRLEVVEIVAETCWVLVAAAD